MLSLASQLIAKVINFEMEMPQDSVWLRDQNRLIPNDNGLYIVVGMINSYTMSNNVYMKTEAVGEGTEQHQINEVMQQETIQVDVLSRSNDALTRAWEVIAAMQSFYCQQIQELNNFKIFRIPRTFLNASSAEGGSQLNRYSISIDAFVWYRKDRILSSPLGDYYDDFSTRVDDKNTIGTDKPLIEFEINSGGIIP